MIVFRQDTVTLVGITRLDFELISPYLKYSDYILRTLGGYSEEVTRVVRQVDLSVRRLLTSAISNQGLSEYNQAVQGPLRAEIGVTNAVPQAAAAYVVVVGIAAESVRLVAEDISNGLNRVLNLFEGRLRQRYEPANPEGLEAFQWLVNTIGDFQPNLNMATWQDSISMPELTPFQRATMNNLLVRHDWSRLFPALFAIQRDLTPIRESYGQVLVSIAGTRGISVTAVRKLLKVKA